MVGKRDRRERDETRRRLLGKRKGKKDKDAFRRNQPPTTIHQDKTRPEKPGRCEEWENFGTVRTKVKWKNKALVIVIVIVIVVVIVVVSREN